MLEKNFREKKIAFASVNAKIVFASVNIFSLKKYRVNAEIFFVFHPILMKAYSIPKTISYGVTEGKFQIYSMHAA